MKKTFHSFLAGFVCLITAVFIMACNCILPNYDDIVEDDRLFFGKYYICSVTKKGKDRQHHFYLIEEEQLEAFRQYVAEHSPEKEDFKYKNVEVIQIAEYSKRDEGYAKYFALFEDHRVFMVKYMYGVSDDEMEASDDDSGCKYEISILETCAQQEKEIRGVIIWRHAYEDFLPPK